MVIYFIYLQSIQKDTIYKMLSRYLFAAFLAMPMAFGRKASPLFFSAAKAVKAAKAENHANVSSMRKSSRGSPADSPALQSGGRRLMLSNSNKDAIAKQQEIEKSENDSDIKDSKNTSDSKNAPVVRIGELENAVSAIYNTQQSAK